MIKHEYFPLSTILYYRIGGTARFLLEAHSRDDVLEALDYLSANNIQRLIVVGLGSNLLFPDGLYDGAVLRITGGDAPQIGRVGDGLIESFAGETLDEVIKYGFDRGLAGLEWAGGLPGTVGAAVRGNVGAFGGEVKEFVRSADILEIGDSGVTFRTLTNDDLSFSYRSSLVKRNRRMVVTSATFALSRADAEEIAKARETYRSSIEYREKNHPMEFPTCGSVFKNIDKKDEVEKVLAVWPDAREMVETRWHGKLSMGYAITRLGLKGCRIGGAQISTKHSNFIVNLGDAGYSDVRGLIEKVQESFHQTFGFTPEAEVEIVDLN
ncbi:MAG: UDP-N-acetylmuramate dehydrogenase [Chloroflexota bacterium]|jgi:UDP-N-acetylmuramate dehydrogenase